MPSRNNAKMTVRAVPAGVDVAEIVGALDEDGAVVLEGALDDDSTTRLRRSVDPLVLAAPLGRNSFDGYATRRIFDPLKRTRALDAVVMHSLVHAVISSALKWPYQFGMTILSEVLPGEQAQWPHRDASVYPLPVGFPEVMINTVCALDSFTSTNGATVVAPGSHRDPLRKELKPVEMNAGSVLIYFGRTLHAAGANVSDGPRLGLIVEHVARWLRPAEAHPLAVGPALARELPPPLQEMLGFNQTSEYFGFVAGASPADWLQKKMGVERA